MEEYDSDGRPEEEQFSLPTTTPFISGWLAFLTAEERSSIHTETAMNYRRSKTPSKLSEFERCSLSGEEWKPRLSKRQREHLKETAV